MRSCIVCASKNLKEIPLLKDVSRKGWSLLVCENCTLGTLDPMPKFAEVEEEYYGEDYGPYQAPKEQKGFRETMKKKLRRATLDVFMGYDERIPSNLKKLFLYPFFIKTAYYPDYVNNGKFLDIGCGSGRQLKHMETLGLGWDSYGIDFSNIAVKQAHAAGLANVSKGEPTNMSFKDSYFDVVSMHHVLEHLPDPHGPLKECKRVLKDSGRLIITVPNFSCLAYKLFGRHWYLDIPRHLYQYDLKSLEIVLRENGFVIDSVYTSDTMVGVMLSVNSMIKFRFKRAFQALGAVADLVIDPLFSRFGSGAQIIIKAKKIDSAVQL